MQSDSVRNASFLSALEENCPAGWCSYSSFDSPKVYHLVAEAMPDFKNSNLLLRLLVENELSRLCVWKNPCNDPHRGIDHASFTEKSLTDVSSSGYRATLKFLKFYIWIAIMETTHSNGLED